jgi:hypothetical protein
MICKECATNLNLMGRGKSRYSRCDWCGKFKPCWERALQQQADPRRGIKDRLTAIAARQAQLADAVQESHELSLERLALLDKFQKLERHLTRVPVTVINTKDYARSKLAAERARSTKRLVHTLTETERSTLIAALEASLKGDKE